MGEMEKLIQKTDKIWLDIDLIWKWKFSKNYLFKTDIDIIFIFKFELNRY